ncbi:MAG TPA: M12 family metallo-peptidase, partial [Phycisphaerales bacterium]|nr:M12 family metallo-peptidase [Phycisphaerales bacterium]
MKIKIAGASWRALVGVVAALVLGGPAGAQEPVPVGVRARLDLAAWGAAFAAEGEFRVEGVPLGDTRQVTLLVRPYRPVTAATSFVLGSTRRPDQELDFNAADVWCFRGAVEGVPGSSVFLGMYHGRAQGWIDLGPGAGRFALATGRPGTWDGDIRVWPLGHPAGVPPEIDPCGGALAADEEPDGHDHGDHDHGDHGHGHPSGPQPRGPTPGPGHKIIELAIETDHEYFQLFGNAADAAAYLVQVVAAINDIYLRDVGVHFVLTYVRIWDTPADLFNEPDPLGPFRTHWNQNMGAVPRDVAHLVSGRRDLPWGGVAYVSALCGSAAYAVSGYANGFFADPSYPNAHNRDITIIAHELGHNCGTFHTHDYALDNCLSLDTPARRGTIMSYCSQTVSGATAVTDLRFCTYTAARMREHIAGRACLAADANLNGVPDSQETAGGAGDANADGIPDSAQDCDGNGVLDPAQIAQGQATDVNANQVPDSCEPDCDGNGVPDRHEIVLGQLPDANRNAVPDACEEDRDNNGQSDYLQIMASMPLDLDRDAVLDSTQDCDGDGVPDRAELGGANGAWVASAAGDGKVRGFYSVVGTVEFESPAATAPGGNDVLVTPGGRVLVSSGATDRVVELNGAGQVIRDLVGAGAGGLDEPAGLALTGAGTLLVASRAGNAVLEFGADTGAFLRVLVHPGSGGLVRPFGLALAPANRLLVTSDDDRVLEYDAGTGAFVRVLVPAGSGGLSAPRGLLVMPTGNLLVASLGSNRVLEYDGQTGAFLRQFNRGGTSVALTMDQPWGLRLGPNGNVFVSRSQYLRLHVNSTRIYEFHPVTGIFMNSYVTGNDTGLYNPTGFDFMPDLAGVDCNLNLRPDSCDLASGTSQDCNANGAPDECDIGGGDSGDANADGVPDECQCPGDFNHDTLVNSGDIS